LLDVGLGVELAGAGLSSLSPDRSMDPRLIGSAASDRFGAASSSDAARESAVGAGLLALRLLAGEGVRESGEGRVGCDCDLGKDVETVGVDVDMFSREGLWPGPLRL
jgi:hypothetical protein